MKETSFLLPSSTSQNHESVLLWGEEIEVREEQKGEVKRRAGCPGLLTATPKDVPIADML